MVSVLYMIQYLYAPLLIYITVRCKVEKKRYKIAGVVVLRDFTWERLASSTLL